MDSAGLWWSGFKARFMQFQSLTWNLHKIILISVGNMEFICGICSVWVKLVVGENVVSGLTSQCKMLF